MADCGAGGSGDRPETAERISTGRGAAAGGADTAWWIFSGIYLAVFAICAVAPHDRGVWWAENLPIVLLAGAIAAVRRRHRFSPVAYGLMLVLLVLHTIGGHYTFERVPFDLVTRAFGFERNHYDRIAHFSVGFYAYPLAELLWARRLTRSRSLLLLFPVFAIFSVAALYELFEWQYALLADPAAGIAVLGSQGDIWDAQKDILADGLGAIAATAFFAMRHGGANKP
jgi:putative membrane protein